MSAKAAKITKANLPSGPWREYEKKGTTSMCSIGPLEEKLTCKTKEGDYVLPVGWEGFIAVDSDGDPYPIELSVHHASYQEA